MELLTVLLHFHCHHRLLPVKALVVLRLAKLPLVQQKPDRPMAQRSRLRLVVAAVCIQTVQTPKSVLADLQ